LLSFFGPLVFWGAVPHVSKKGKPLVAWKTRCRRDCKDQKELKK